MTKDDYLWAPSATPDPEIVRLENALAVFRLENNARNPNLGESADARPDKRVITRSHWGSTAARESRHRLSRYLVAASVAALVILGVYKTRQYQSSAWRVAVIEPSGSRSLANPGRFSSHRLQQGEWIETDSVSTLRLNVGTIGRASIGPNSRLKILTTGPREHRLALGRGRLHARIWAPPRFFVVETPSAVAVDLGCVYTLEVDSVGTGVLEVESGEVELMRGNAGVVVPAGNFAYVSPAGVGLPMPVSSNSSFRRLARMAAKQPDDTVALRQLIAASDARNTITLWYLTERAPKPVREIGLRGLARIAPPRKGVSLNTVILGDPTATAQWKNELAEGWSSEPVPRWKRAWRALWRRST